MREKTKIVRINDFDRRQQDFEIGDCVVRGQEIPTQVGGLEELGNKRYCL